MRENKSMFKYSIVTIVNNTFFEYKSTLKYLIMNPVFNPNENNIEPKDIVIRINAPKPNSLGDINLVYIGKKTKDNKAETDFPIK